MAKFENALFYFLSGSNIFCNNAVDEDFICIQEVVLKRVDRYEGCDVFYCSLDAFRELLHFRAPIKRAAYTELYNIAFAINKEKGKVFGEMPTDVANYNFFDYKDKIIKRCIEECENYALHPRLSNSKNKNMCLKNTYWIFANYFALMNNSLEFTAEQLEIIQKCHDNELPRTYAEELYNKLLALLPPKTETEQEAELITLYSEKVNDKIRAKYSISQEFAILRQRDTKPDEFNEYNAYCEQCKAEAKSEVHDENS